MHCEVKDHSELDWDETMNKLVEEAKIKRQEAINARLDATKNEEPVQKVNLRIPGFHFKAITE